MPVSVKVDDREVKVQIDGLQHSLKNLSPIFRVIGEDVRNSVRENFRVQGRPTRWLPWSDEYGEWRKENRPGKILTLTRRLANSITMDVTAHDVVVGTNLKYAATHHFGDKKRNIPARPYMLLQPSDEEDIANTMDDWIQGVIDGRY